MPYLGDFLGRLMAEVTLARVQADVEALRVAELYSGHDLLRHFPVPRVRLPDVQIDLAFVNKDGAEDTAGPRDFPSAKDIATAFLPKAVAHLKSAGVDLSANRVRTLEARLLKRTATFEQPAGIPVDVSRLSSELAKETLAILNKAERGKLSRQDWTEQTRELGRLVRQTAIELQPPPLRMEVGVTPEEIRDAGEAVTRIRLSIGEEGLEWTSIEIDGKTIDRLVME